VIGTEFKVSNLYGASCYSVVVYQERPIERERARWKRECGAPRFDEEDRGCDEAMRREEDGRQDELKESSVD
jgi:hypothetical protein